MILHGNEIPQEAKDLDTYFGDITGPNPTAAAMGPSTNWREKFKTQLSLYNMKYIQDINTRGALSQAQVICAGERSPASVQGRPQQACGGMPSQVIFSSKEVLTKGKGLALIVVM